jgi:hypothetical protein
MPAKSYQTVGEVMVAAENPSNDQAPNDSRLDHDEPQNLLRNQRKARRDNVLSELSPLLSTKDSERAKEQDDRKKRISRVWGALHGLSAYRQILTPWWILVALFVMVQMLRLNFFVATVRSQYYYMLGNYDRAVLVNSFFDVALPGT